MNTVNIMGRFVRTPELKRTQSGTAVASFTLAVDRGFADKDGNRQADFIDCVAWKGTAEFVTKYFVKGQMAAVTGALRTRTWEDDSGTRRKSVEVLAERVYFTGGKKDGSEQDATSAPIPARRPVDVIEDDYEDYPFDRDEDLPF